MQRIVPDVALVASAFALLAAIVVLPLLR